MAQGASRTFKPGDQVAWKTSQGQTEGTIVKKVVRTAQIAGHVAKASPAEPQYEVQSSKSGKHAIHKPHALKKKA